MGKSEQEAVEALCISDNDSLNAIALLGLGAHEYIEYYIEELCHEEYMQHNLFVNLLSFLRKRLERCTSYCISCGKKLIEASFRLSPCTADFCMFKFEEIFGIKLYAELQNSLSIIELDLSFACKAVGSARCFDIFEPFPSFFLKQKEERQRSTFTKTAIVDVQKENKDLEQLSRILSAFPSLAELKETTTCEVAKAVVHS